MLTAELVNARRRGSELFISKLGDEGRARALDLAREMVDLFRTSIGLSRDEVEARLGAVDVAPREQRVKDGLAKLLDDRAAWNLAAGLDPEQVRRELFLRATKVRRSLPNGTRFDRQSVIAEAAAELGVKGTVLDGALYADLRGASVLSDVEAISPTALVDLYERSQAQAVLLRAVRIKVVVRCALPAAAGRSFDASSFSACSTIQPAPRAARS